MRHTCPCSHYGRRRVQLYYMSGSHISEFLVAIKSEHQLSVPYQMSGYVKSIGDLP
jgi:hypothetical protein